jgi:hypothetical protein
MRAQWKKSSVASVNSIDSRKKKLKSGNDRVSDFLAASDTRGESTKGKEAIKRAGNWN